MGGREFFSVAVLGSECVCESGCEGDYPRLWAHVVCRTTQKCISRATFTPEHDVDIEYFLGAPVVV